MTYLLALKGLTPVQKYTLQTMLILRFDVVDYVECNTELKVKSTCHNLLDECFIALVVSVLDAPVVAFSPFVVM